MMKFNNSNVSDYTSFVYGLIIYINISLLYGQINSIIIDQSFNFFFGITASIIINIALILFPISEQQVQPEEAKEKKKIFPLK